MSRRGSHSGIGILSVLASSVLAVAQTSTTGAFQGRLIGPDGKPVAGATVTLSSDQITRTARTDAAGAFALSLLNPGRWRLVLSAQGLQTVSLVFQVAANDTRAATFRMSAIARAQVDVVGVVSTVDPTTSQLGSHLFLEDLAAIPVSRDANDLMLLAPGVVDSGFNVGPYAGTFRTNNPSVGGGSAAENQYVLDGLVTTDFRYGVQSSALPTDFLDQVEVQTGGFKPEYGALGGIFNAITKSGSNTFQGSAWATVDPYNGFAQPKQNAFFIAAQNMERYDVGFQVGGPIIKDRLFYFAGLDSITQTGHPTPNFSGETDSAQKVTENNALLKINAYLTPEQQITVTCRADPQVKNNGNLYAAYGPGNEGDIYRTDTQSLSISYDLILSPTLLLSLKLGRNAITSHDSPTDGTDPGMYDWVQNGGVGTSYGGDGTYEQTNDSVSKQFKVDLTWMLGSHTLKFGYGFLQSRFTKVIGMTGGDFLEIYSQALQEIFYSFDSSALAKYRNYYAQDTWDAGKGVKLAYGVRFDEQEMYGQNGLPIFKFNRPGDYLQPRLGFIWDPHGDGKSKLSANYAVYFESIPQDLGIDYFSPNVTYTVYNWYSPSYTYDPTNPNHYGTVIGGIYTAMPPGGGLGPSANQVFNYGATNSMPPIENGIKLPRRVEYTLGYDRQLSRSVTVGIHGTYRKLTDILEDSVLTDAAGMAIDGSTGPSSPHAILWNPGPGPVSYSTNAFGDLNPHAVQLASTPFPVPYNLYRSLDAVIDWHAERAALHASYTWSRLYGNYEGLVSSSNGQAAPNITSFLDYYTYYGTGLLPLDRTHLLKAYGSRRIPFRQGNLNLGFNLLVQSGTPISMIDDGSTTHGKPPGYDTTYNTNHPGSTGPGTVAATPADFNNPAYWSGQPVGSTPQNGGTYYTGPGYASLDIGGYGSANYANDQQGNYGRTPTTGKLDLHADFDWRLEGWLHVIPALDVFNALNSRQAISVSSQGNLFGLPNPAYGQATAYQPGRNFRLSLRARF